MRDCEKRQQQRQRRRVRFAWLRQQRRTTTTMQTRGGGDRVSPAVRKGPWTAEEDEVLRRHVREHGAREWSSIRSKGLLPRTGKSCRLRWVNKLRPNLKSGCKFSAEEERVVIDLQAQFGNKWARIATYLPGRTDNDVKNFWSTRQKRLARMLRAPLPRRRSGTGRHSGGGGGGGGGGASSSSAAAASHELLHASEPLCQDQDPCFGMIPFQETTMHHHHHTGQSSQEPLITAASHCAGAPLFPGFLAPEPVLPSPIGFAAAGCSSSYTGAAPAAAHHHLSFLCAGDPAPMVDHAAGLVVDAASVGNDGGGVAYMEPKLEQQRPDQFFGVLEVEDDEYDHGHVAPARRSGTPDVLFDDLPPEMFDFFELPPPPSPSSQL